MQSSSAVPAAPPASDEGTRRSMMSNRRADTKPEIAFRSMLHRSGLRFRKDRYIKFERRGVKVDVVFPTEKVAVFIDGCFWHRCPEHATRPATTNTGRPSFNATWIAIGQMTRIFRTSAGKLSESGSTKSKISSLPNTQSCKSNPRYDSETPEQPVSIHSPKCRIFIRRIKPPTSQ